MNNECCKLDRFYNRYKSYFIYQTVPSTVSGVRANAPAQTADHCFPAEQGQNQRGRRNLPRKLAQVSKTNIDPTVWLDLPTTVSHPPVWGMHPCSHVSYPPPKIQFTSLEN